MSAGDFEDSLDVIDKKFDLAKRLFTKIYGEYINSEEFQEWEHAKAAWRIREGEIVKSDDYIRQQEVYTIERKERIACRGFNYIFSQQDKDLEMKADSTWLYGTIARAKLDLKLSLLRAYLGLPKGYAFPKEWEERCL